MNTEKILIVKLMLLDEILPNNSPVVIHSLFYLQLEETQCNWADAAQPVAGSFRV